MSFLNMAMLGGMAAVLAPLLIHLLNRSRYKSMDWGAMHLLESAMQVNTRRFQWESILLLLIRCGIPLLFAACLARPVLTYSRIAGALGKKSMALVIDDSLSMNRKLTPDETLFQAAQRELSSLTDEFRSAEFSVWTAGVRPTCLTEGSTFDASRVSATIDQVRSGAGSIQALNAIAAAAGQLTGMSNPSKHVVLASDFCESDWAAITDADLSAMRDRLASFNPPVYLSLLRISPGSRSSRLPAENLAINLADDLEPRLLPNETAAFTYSVRNFGPQTVEDVPVVFSVDGSDVARRVVTVPVGGAAQASFACSFDQPAWHLIAGRIGGDTGPNFDDSQHAVVEVIEPCRVLLVTSQPGEAFRPSMEYLKLALAPFEAGESGSNRFQVALALATELTSAALEQQQVVILAGAQRLSDSISNLLVEFVRSGRGLIVFPDDNLDLEWFNERFYDQDKLLPMRFAGTQEGQEPVQLLRETIQFPHMQIFNNPQFAGDLGEWEFNNWQQLEEPRDDTLVIFRMSSGAAFLATHSYGRGSVYQCAVSSHDNWSNLPLKSAFVPFVQQLTLSAAAGLPLANIRCGESARISVGKVASEPRELELMRRDERIQLVITPISGTEEAADQLSTSVEIEPASDSAQWSDTRYPGIFRLAVQDAAYAAPSSRPSIEPPFVSVQRSLGESDLRTLSETQVQQLANRLGATVVGSAEEFSQSDWERQIGREIWKWLLAALLVLLVAEVFVIRGMTRGVGA